MTPVCDVRRLGLVPYREAWELQDRLAQEIALAQRPPTLLLLEHPPTFTFGRRGRAENLLWDQAELARRGVEVHWVDRGGDVTFHGPGQLVGYPLLPLAPGGLAMNPAPDGALRLPRADYVGYVRRLEKVLILALAQFGVAGEQIEGLTGVWVQPARALRQGGGPPAKIASIGVKVDARGVSQHGFALNVHPDMSYWEGIIGCGLKGAPVASLADYLDPPPSLDQVMEKILQAFGKIFGYRMREGEGGG